MGDLIFVFSVEGGHFTGASIVEAWLVIAFNRGIAKTRRFLTPAAFFLEEPQDFSKDGLGMARSDGLREAEEN